MKKKIFILMLCATLGLLVLTPHLWLVFGDTTGPKRILRIHKINNGFGTKYDVITKQGRKVSYVDLENNGIADQLVESDGSIFELIRPNKNLAYADAREEERYAQEHEQRNFRKVLKLAQAK